MVQQSNSLSRRLQHHVVSKLSTRNFMKHVLPEDSLFAFDVLHTVLRHYYDEKTSERVIKNILKLVAKLALVFHDEKNVDKHEDALADTHEKVHSFLLTVCCYHDLAHSYCQKHILDVLNEAEASLLVLIEPILSDKSAGRARFIFEHLRNPELLDAFFQADGPHRKEREELVRAIDLFPF
ncbi:Protein of unknown function DUF758 domain containing protein [Aphelenchoides fujianensis]|nr:Protein of unknown function DUF758 domain containing protein [Aphelenchoides fujianensis]